MFSTTYRDLAVRLRSPEFRFGGNWLRMLSYAVNFEATDDRDRIFGLLGLSKFADQCRPLQADYAKSTLEVYKDIVEVAIRNSNNLDILLFAGYSWEAQPSWIPQLLPADHLPPVPSSGIPWTTNAGYPAEFSIKKRKGILSISGIIIDEIDQTRFFDRSIFSTMDEYNRPRPLFSGGDMVIFDAGLWKDILEFSKCCRRDDPLTACSMVLTYGMDVDRHRVQDEQKRREDFAEFLSQRLGDELLPYENIQAALQSGGGKADDFLHAGNSNCLDGCFFTTPKGYIGCAQKRFTQKGDLLCVLSGGRFPFILRPDGRGYILISYAYVQGIMDGEAINEATKALESNKFQRSPWRTFKLQQPRKQSAVSGYHSNFMGPL
jgi:hypothetical protein